MFFLWLVFTSNLISQTTWLKVKLKLVNFNEVYIPARRVYSLYVSPH